MADSFTKVTHTSYGSRLKNSIVGTFIGIILFFASFYVLFTNEGRVDVSKIAEQSIEMKQDSGDYEGKFISLSGDISSQEQIGDAPYIKEGDYVILYRKAEMFAWEETSSSETKENYGGSSTTTTTYSYNKKWLENPENSSNFEEKSGHINPEKTIDSRSSHVSKASIGEYSFSLSGMRQPGGKKLSLHSDLLISQKIETEKKQVQEKKLTQKQIILQRLREKREGNSTASGSTEKKIDMEESVAEKVYDIQSNYIYIGSGSLNSPQVGDIRISYKVLKSGDFSTVFGQAEGKEIVAYNEGSDEKVFHLFDKDRQGSIEELHTQYLFLLWIMRGVGFAMMWFGLQMMLGLLTTILAVIPPLAQLGRFLTGLAAFIVSVVLTLLTILIGIMFHNIYILLGVIAVGGGFAIWFLKKKSAKKEETTPGDDILDTPSVMNQTSNSTTPKSGNMVTSEKKEQPLSDDDILSFEVK